jgi:hypothetical protein
MSIATANHRAQLFWRIGLWFLSLIVAVSLFSLAFGALFNGSVTEGFSVIFRITMIFAFPVACLYLPVVIGLRNAAKQRLWFLLISGALIGPVCIVLLSFVELLMGQSARDILYGDPLAGPAAGLAGSMILAFVVGTLTTLLYILLLRISRLLAAASHSSAA